MLLHANRPYAIADQIADVEFGKIHQTLLFTRSAGLQDLLDRTEQPFVIRQHHVVKLLLLFLGDIAAL